MSEKTSTIEAKLKELDELLAWFESDDVSVDDALKQYEKAQKLAKDLRQQLKDAKNSVDVIKKKFA